MITYQKKEEEEFVTQGGIRERMTAARLGYRTDQRDTIERLNREIQALKQENSLLKHTQTVTSTQPRLISSVSLIPSVSSTHARVLAVYRELILSPLGVASLYRVVVNCFQICIFADAQTTLRTAVKPPPTL